MTGSEYASEPNEERIEPGSSIVAFINGVPQVVYRVVECRGALIYVPEN